MQIRQLAQHASCCALSQPATNSSLRLISVLLEAKQELNNSKKRQNTGQVTGAGGTGKSTCPDDLKTADTGAD